jgi:hypothetical protein
MEVNIIPYVTIALQKILITKPNNSLQTLSSILREVAEQKESDYYNYKDVQSVCNHLVDECEKRESISLLIE